MSDRAQMGDNSRHFGEDLREDVETILSDDHEKLFHFAKWHIDDYIAGTVGMKLEAEGAYIRFLMRLYQRGKPLPDDDRFMAIAMNLSIRVWKRIKDSLISIGKIVRKAGCLTNPRFERERKARAEQLQKQAQAARDRWARERANQETSPKLEESLDEVSPKLSQSIGKKSNKNNAGEGNQPDITRVLKSLDLSEHKAHLGSEGAREARSDTHSPSAGHSGLVEANGFGIKGPGFVLPYGSIDIEASMRNMPVKKARGMAMAIAEGWAANQYRPKDPVREFVRIIREEQNDSQRNSYALAKFKKSPDDKPSDMPDEVWAAIRRERDRKAFGNA